VVGIDNINDYYEIKWKQNNLDQLIKNKNFTFYKIDIINEDKLSELCQKFSPEIIIHLAARAGVRPSIIDPKLYELVNIRGTLNMLEIAKDYKVNKFIFASSSSVYGNSSKTPFTETDRVDFPISPYASTKKAGEELCYTYSHLYNLSISCLRFFTVYGPKGRPDMAPYMFTEAIATGKPIKRFGNGTTGRDYTYIDDIVNGIIAAANYLEPFDIFNLGNSSPVLLNTFISTIEKIVGKYAIIEEFPMQQGDVDITYADINKAKELLGYSPETSLEEGMQIFYNWLKDSRW
jgi:UDP-glucuronate 4-epimerase